MLTGTTKMDERNEKTEVVFDSLFFRVCLVVAEGKVQREITPAALGRCAKDAGVLHKICP